MASAFGVLKNLFKLYPVIGDVRFGPIADIALFVRFPKFWNFTVGRFLFFPKSKNGRWGRCARNARTLVRENATIGSSPFFEGDIFITEAFEFSFQVFITAALRKTRHGPRYRRRPGAGGGCGSVDPNRRREQLAAQPASRGCLGRRRLPPRGAHALCGRCERATARRDVVDQQRTCLNECRR